MITQEQKIIQKAVSVAAEAHNEQYRKATGLPYITHPLAVMGLARKVTEDHEILAACALHDVMEDASDKYSWEQMHQDFGARVVRIVEGVTKIEHDDWQVRADAYIEHLKTADEGSLIVCASDKLHNIRCTIKELREFGNDSREGFSTNVQRQLWWNDAVCSLLEQRIPTNQLVYKLRHCVEELRSEIS